MRFLALLLALLFLFPAVILAAIDLQITPSNITFSNSTPIEGEIILINATFSNIENQNASNVLVQFFDDLILLGNATISVPAVSSATVSQVWEAEIGPNNIRVVLDPTNTIPETNENNNEAGRNISINAYHTYFGNAREVTALGIFFDTLFERDEPACNVLVADTDSNVDFSSLQALGIKKNGGNAKHDFKDLDIVLNMTDFEDSISTLYSKNALGEKAKETADLFVFGNTINKIPVINSTNSTTFRTGILWDKSDDGQGCGNEDDDDEDNDDSDEDDNDDDEDNSGGDEDDEEDNDNEKLEICHIPPGNPDNAHTIEVSQSAVPAHLAHGDYLGECQHNKKSKKKEFDTCDQEDVVLIAKVKPLEVGKFGRYDYEGKIPALIRDSKQGSSSVDFYLDLSSPCP